MKRFYTEVDISKTPNGDSDGEGYHIVLDGKPVKTPAKNTLILPNQEIAEQVKQEWLDQEDEVNPQTMSLTQICVTAQDYVAQNRPGMEDLIKKYLQSDLLCFQTDDPPELCKHQEAHWSPWVSWFKDYLKIDLPIKKDIQAHDPSEADIEAITHYMANLDLYPFTVFQLLVSATGSLILACAFMNRRVNQDEIFQLAKLEELFFVEFYKLEQHGMDPQQEKEFTTLKRDLHACTLLLDNL